MVVVVGGVTAACSLHVEEKHWLVGLACGEEEADRRPHAKEIQGILLNHSWYRK
jgi:hypothetical protein